MEARSQRALSADNQKGTQGSDPEKYNEEQSAEWALWIVRGAGGPFPSAVAALGVNLPGFTPRTGVDRAQKGVVLGRPVIRGTTSVCTHASISSTLLSAWHMVGTRKYLLNEYVHENCP